MSGFLIITADNRAEIAALVAKARQTMRPWSEIKDIVQREDTVTDTLTLAERQAPAERLREIQQKYPVQRIQLGSYDVALSFDEQPAGVFRHLSVSSATAGKVPNEFVIEMLVKEFGFSGWPPTQPYRVWLEEFAPGHNAVNLMELEA